MTLPQQPNGAPQRRKPIWPWIVLLVLTLCAIYSYNRANEIIAELSDTLPPALLNLFEDILRGRPARPWRAQHRRLSETPAVKGRPSSGRTSCHDHKRKKAPQRGGAG